MTDNNHPKLSTGFFTNITEEKTTPVLQILEIACELNSAGNKYEMIVSDDGQVTRNATTSLILNHLHTSGTLFATTVVRIEEYKTVIESGKYLLMISALNVVNNWLDVAVILEKPSMPQDLYFKIYNLFDILDLDDKKEVYKNISKELTTKYIKYLYHGTRIQQMVLQIIAIVKVIEDNSIRYSLFLSDGVYSYNNFRIDNTDFNDFVDSGKIGEHSVIHLVDYDVIKGDAMGPKVYVIYIEPMHQFPFPIGNSNLFKEEPTEYKIPTLSLMLDEAVVLSAVLQVVEIKKRGSSMYKLTVYDGYNLANALLSINNDEKKTMDENLCKWALIVVNKYEVIAGNKFTGKKPVLNILQLSFITERDSAFDSILLETPAFKDKLKEIYTHDVINDLDELAAMKSNLTPDFFSRHFEGFIYDRAILQVLAFVKIVIPEFDSINYRLILSDGTNSYNQINIKCENFNNLIKSGKIVEFSIIRASEIKRLQYNQIEIYNITVLNVDGENVKKKIGDPSALGDKIFIPTIRSNKFIPKLTDNCISKLLTSTYAFSLPIIQILALKKFGSDYKLAVSDGQAATTTATLNSEMMLYAEFGKFKEFTVIRVDSYEILYEKVDEVNYRQCLNILKVTIIFQGGLHVFKTIGAPEPLSALLKYDQEDIAKAKKNNKKVEKSNENKKTNKKELKVLSHPLNFDKMLERQVSLNDQISILSLQLEEINKAKADFKDDINKLENENSKLKTLIENMEKKKFMEKQELLLNDIEIFGIEEGEDENLFLRIRSLGFGLPINIQPDDIKSLFRDPKSKSIVASFVNKNIKENFILNYRKSKTKKCTIDIYEHLTPHNKNILRKAKQLMKAGKFVSVDVENGRVLVKKKLDDSESVHIYSLSQIFYYSKQ